MAKTKTVTVHARIPAPDVAEVDKAAEEELSTRSNMLARIVREWVKRRQLPPKKRLR
jgi:metal-responsive CopG/Arc/MetJ family transcriptional regulator